MTQRPRLLMSLNWPPQGVLRYISFQRNSKRIRFAGIYRYMFIVDDDTNKRTVHLPGKMGLQKKFRKSTIEWEKCQSQNLKVFKYTPFSCLRCTENLEENSPLPMFILTCL